MEFTSRERGRYRLIARSTCDSIKAGAAHVSRAVVIHFII